jgi:hypothetical protein
VPVEEPDGIGPGIYRADMGLKVAPSGKRVAVAFPLVCGTTVRGVITAIRISDAGKFSATREYEEKKPGTTLNWSLKVSGTFTSTTRAKGKLTVGLRRHGVAGSGRENEIVCGSKKDVPWTAKYRPAT